MATLSVLKFDDPNGADRVLIALQGMQERQLITLEDAAVVSWPQGNKKPTTRQLHSTAGAGAMSGAFWGFLFGLIFFVHMPNSNLDPTARKRSLGRGIVRSPQCATSALERQNCWPLQGDFASVIPGRRPRATSAPGPLAGWSR